MPISKICEQCHKAYTIPKCRVAKARFCSMACRNANDRTAERRSLVCETCGDNFTAVQDHGVWPRFCSRKCFLNQCIRPTEKQCTLCGSLFVARSTSHTTEDGRRTYCSAACAREAQKNGSEHQCLNCGKLFYLSSSKLKQREEPGCCSYECRNAFYTGPKSAAYKGGTYTHTQMGEKHVLMPRPGYVSKYTGEHRLIASREIGRLVKRGEVVLRINRNPQDNRPENLFICESISEFSKRRSGSLPWPKKSNLRNFKDRKC